MKAWWLSAVRAACASTTASTEPGAAEADGHELTADARAAFVRDEGAWVATLTDAGPRRVDVLKALRALLALSPADAVCVSEVKEGDARRVRARQKRRSK